MEQQAAEVVSNNRVPMGENSRTFLSPCCGA